MNHLQAQEDVKVAVYTAQATDPYIERQQLLDAIGVVLVGLSLLTALGVH